MDTTYSPIGGKVSDKTEKKGMCEEADKTKQEYLNISTVQILYLLKFGSISIFSRKKKKMKIGMKIPYPDCVVQQKSLK